MRSLMQLIKILAGGIGIAVVVYFASLVATPGLSFGEIENIYGIPYPHEERGVMIEEELAHVDMYPGGPVFAKKVKLEVEFDPHSVEELAVGVRENPFWLSYQKRLLYRAAEDVNEMQTKVITIPLTDKLQDRDQSLDIMFFVKAESSPYWELRNLNGEITWDVVTYTQLKDYIRGIVKRERAL